MANNLFEDIYLERSNKETEELVAEENIDFLEQPIRYFHEHLEEFLYIESPLLTEISVDAISFEVDDVFRTYDVILGLQKQKKHATVIRTFFSDHTNSNDGFDCMFDAQEGIWNINFSLHTLPGFHEELSIREAYELIYDFISRLVQTIDQ